MRGRIFRSITLVSLLGVLLACLAVVGLLLGQFYATCAEICTGRCAGPYRSDSCEGEGVLPAFAAAGVAHYG